jgi:hypothetical protein
MSRAQKLREERERRAAIPAAISAMLDGLHPSQRKFVDSTSKFRTLRAGRRSGKTTVLSRLAMRAVMLDFPGEVIPIVEKALTTQATTMMWKELRATDQLYNLGCAFNNASKTMTAPNGGQVVLMGADTEDSADKLRGNRYPLVMVDECGTFRPSILKFLIDDCVEPALLDHGGSLVLAGTPNLVKRGPFWEAVSGERRGYQDHHWTFLDNDALPLGNEHLTPQERRALRETQLRELRERKGWDSNNPSYLREYMGMWAEANGGGAFQLNPALNVIDTLDMGDVKAWEFFLSCDIGFNDAAASVVWGRRTNDPWLYVLWSDERARLVPTRWAAWVDSLKERWNFREMVADTGGQGKAYTEQARESLGMVFSAADKRGKMASLDYANGDLQTGRVKIVGPENRKLIEDIEGMVLNEDGDDFADDADDHLPHAFLYGHRAVSRWAFESLEGAERASVGKHTQEWWQDHEDEMIDRLVEDHLTANRRDVEF